MGGDPLRALIDAAREGDDAALGELVRRTQPAVGRLCELLGSGHDRDDLVQDTYLRALRSLDTYRGDAPVQAWLLQIARHVCADSVRRAQRRRKLIHRMRLNAVESVPAHDASSQGLLEYIDPDRRAAFVLTQELGLSYDDAALVLECAVGTIRSRVARARAELRDLLRQSEAR